MSERSYDAGVSVSMVPGPPENGGIRSEDGWHREESWKENQAATIFLWLTAVSILGAIYLYQLGDLWTFMLVMSASLFLGLFTFALMMTTDYRAWHVFGSQDSSDAGNTPTS